jgi:hypothetical protein
MSKIQQYGTDDYRLMVNPGGKITLDVGSTGGIEITGNLTVNGELTSINTTNLDIEDNIITLNKGESGAGVSLVTSGVRIDRGTLPNTEILFDESITWLDSQTSTVTSGAFTFTDASGNTVGIVTNSVSTQNNNDLVLLGSGTGKVTVTGTDSYEKQLFPYDGGLIAYDSTTVDQLAPPNDADGLVNVQLLQDYVRSYTTYNWQDRIVSPVPNGNSMVRVYSTQAGYPSSKIDLSLNGSEIFSFGESEAIAKTDITTTLTTFNLINTTASEVNAFGDATDIKIGASSGITLINNELNVAGNLKVLPGSSITDTLFNYGVVRDSLILLNNTDQLYRIPTAADIQLSELYLNTTDGKIYFKRFKNSVSTIREVGLADRVADVYYVSDKSGNDTNDGTTLSEPFKTIDAALQTIQNIRAGQDPAEFSNITVYVKSGRYTIDNPVRLPARVALVGDSLRTVTIRPLNLTEDMFWVYNGSYITQVTFKDNLAPSAAVSFPPDGSAGFISQSPYVQNCTTITTTGTGMRVDGAHVLGLRSMVCDAFTQYNQGGIGIHMLNRGNTQLVSIFTICCEIAFLCERGGFCSITNSNSTFGNYGLKADGVSTALYSGRVSDQPQTNQFIIDRLVNKPNIGDAVKFYGDANYYTVREVGDLNVQTEVIELQYFDKEPIEYTDDRDYILSQLPYLRTEAIMHIQKEYPFFQYNEQKCSRDIGLIIEAVTDDMVFGTNYRTVLAGRSYLRAVASNVIDNQLTETVSAINKVRDLILGMVDMGTTQYNRVLNNFNLITNIMQNGAGAIPNITYPSPIGVDSYRKKASDILQANRDFLIEEGIAFINNNLNLIPSYNSTTCARDVGLIIDALRYDMMFGSNFRSIVAGRSYYRAGASVVTTSQKLATLSALEYLKFVIIGLVSGNAGAEASVSDNMDIIIDILDNGLSAIPVYVIPAPAGYNVGMETGRDAIESNRASIISQVTTYINTNYPSLTYDVAKCQRDIGYILDAVYYDMTYSGNLESLVAGNAYYSGAVLQVPTGQKAATLAAFTYMKSLIATITSSNAPVSAFAQALIQNVITIIDTQSQPATIAPDLSWVNTELTDRNTILVNNKEAVKTGIIAHIDGTFVYDVETCERDIGLIIDAISYDMIFGSNFRSITAGRSYYRGGAAVVVATQKIATLGAFAYLKNRLITQVTGNGTAVTSVNNNMNIILEILRDGLTAVPAYVIPDPLGYNAGFANSRDLIEDNRAFIKAEIIAYISKAYPNLVYNQTTCQRDVGYILDALYYDMTYGGNLETIIAANAYYSNSIFQVASTEKLATLAAYKYLKKLVGYIALNNTVTALQNLVSQVNGTSGTTDASEYAQLLIETVRTTVDTTTPQVSIIPNVTWVDSNLLDRHYILTDGILNSASSVTEYIAGDYLYSEAICRRDIGYIVDAISYDMLYQGNTQSDVAGRSYFNAGIMQIPDADVQPSLDTFNYVKDVAKLCVTNDTVSVINTNSVIQDVSLPGATATEQGYVEDLFTIITNLLDNRYSALITLEEEIREDIILPGIPVTFHQLSLITSSSHTFEWIGSGTDVNIALPYLGGTPEVQKEIIEVNGGRVYFTGTDQRGDFKIGTQLKINRAKGVIEGRVFRKSLYSTLTPYILAIGEG